MWGGVGFGFGGVTVKATHKTFTSVREIDIQNFKSFGNLFIETQQKFNGICIVLDATHNLKFRV